MEDLKPPARTLASAAGFDSAPRIREKRATLWVLDRWSQIPGVAAAAAPQADPLSRLRGPDSRGILGDDVEAER
jgi:hypothetical protein